jgi:hypothetical protein
MLDTHDCGVASIPISELSFLHTNKYLPETFLLAFRNRVTALCELISTDQGILQKK